MGCIIFFHVRFSQGFQKLGSFFLLACVKLSCWPHQGKSCFCHPRLLQFYGVNLLYHCGFSSNSHFVLFATDNCAPASAYCSYCSWLMQLAGGCTCRQLSSVQDGIYALGKAHMRSNPLTINPIDISQKLPQCCLCNSSGVGLTGEGHFSSCQGRWWRTSSFYRKNRRESVAAWITRWSVNPVVSVRLLDATGWRTSFCTSESTLVQTRFCVSITR